MERLTLVGAGPVGVAAAQAALDERCVDAVTAVVDPDPAARQGAVDRFAASGHESVAQLPPAQEGDCAVVAFSSRASLVAPEILRLLDLGYSIVTTCEELADPLESVESIEGSARAQGKVVIVTGANPGFVMDRLPLLVAGACRSVRSIHVTRRVDTSDRRGPLVAKTGRGLTVEAFNEEAASGRIGHVGLAASARLLAAGLGWEAQDVTKSLGPVVGEDGTASGLTQQAILRAAQGETVRLDLTMSWRLDDPGDTISVDGDPPLVVAIPGGYHGDSGTTAQVVRALERSDRLPPGFYRPTDLPLRPT